MKHLPNALTIGNLISGCLGLLYIERLPLHTVAYFVWAAAAFDFLDGYAARLFKASSPIGKQLDSLADMVSFGVLPAAVMFVQLSRVWPGGPAAGCALALAICAALRLARFNLNEDQQASFIGMPTPATALFITGLPSLFHLPPLERALANGSVLCIISVVSAWLMVAPAHFFALKFKNFNWAENRIKFSFLLLSATALVLLQAQGISLVIVLYAGISLLTEQDKR